MNRKKDLTKGNIFKTILLLALPIMGTSFVQMAYNLIDMIWIGKLGSDPLASVGTAGFFMWLSMGVVFLCKIGAEVLVAQSIGRKDEEGAKKIVQSVLQLVFIFGVTTSLILVLFKTQLIQFFNLEDTVVINGAISYLAIIGGGVIFSFVNPVLTAIFNGYGKSAIPFGINTVGLIFNIIFDPILIFGFGPIPAMGIEGAAIATVTSQLLVTVVFIIYIKTQKDMHLFEGFKLFRKLDGITTRKIIKLGFPVGLQSILFCIFAMVIARIVGQWGPLGVAVQKVGAQIESISWMTASGFSTAIGTFIGQNLGAKKYKRIYDGYLVAFISMFVFGILTSVLLLVFAEPIFGLFLSEADELREGTIYLQILGFSQLFMCLEIVTNGAFNGLGKTKIPAINSSVFNFLRIPGAIILSATALSLTGVWWSVTISSIIKGIVIVSFMAYTLIRFRREHEFEPVKLLKKNIV